MSDQDDIPVLNDLIERGTKSPCLTWVWTITPMIHRSGQRVLAAEASWRRRDALEFEADETAAVHGRR